MMEIYLDELIQPIHDEFNSNFQIIETIASGSFGTVLKAFQIANNREVAVKVIDKTLSHQNYYFKIKQEVQILKQLKHKNIVELLGFWETNTKLYIVMEYINNGTLKTFLEKRKENLTEEEASRIIQSLLSAVEYIHNLDICHRDIKPANVMFNDINDLSSLKLVDFGLSARDFGDMNDNDRCGTLLYMPPELIEKRKYSKSMDLWSVGIIMFMLLNRGQHPFYSKGDDKKSFRFKLKHSKPTLFYKCSEMARLLLFKLLDPNPNERYSAIKALHHPWITRGIFDLIPQTFFETLRSSQIKKKAFQLIGIGILLSRLAKTSALTREYHSKVNESCKLNKETYRRRREQSFNIVNIQNETNSNSNSVVLDITSQVRSDKLSLKDTDELITVESLLEKNQPFLRERIIKEVAKQARTRINIIKKSVPTWISKNKSPHSITANQTISVKNQLPLIKWRACQENSSPNIFMNYKAFSIATPRVQNPKEKSNEIVMLPVVLPRAHMVSHNSIVQKKKDQRWISIHR